MNHRAYKTLVIVCALASALSASNAQETRPTTRPKKEKPAKEKVAHAALLNPSLATEKAPEKFRVQFSTTKGDFQLEVTRAWSPKGADRFYNLVKIGFFTDIAFFRVLKGFMAQFGLHGDHQVTAKWRTASIQDEKVMESNQRGYISFAKGGRNSRTTQLFINYGDNSRLDGMGFSPFGVVLGDGMKVVDALYNGYGDGPQAGGAGPSQDSIKSQGNEYLRREFSKFDYIKSVTLITK